MAAGGPGSSGRVRYTGRMTAASRTRVPVAEWSASLTRSAAAAVRSGRVRRVRGPSGTLLFLSLTIITVLAARSLFGDLWDGDAAVTADVARDLGPTIFPMVGQHRRRTIKPTWCGWLLASCLLSGDIELNPGPSGRQRALRVYCQNVCSLKNKLSTLRSHAGELVGYDAVGLTESWLGPHVLDSELQLGFPDHVWFRKDRDGRGGGVACAVKSSLSPVRRTDLEPDCEVLVLQLGTAHPVLLAVCYRPPDADCDVDTIAAFVRRVHAAGHPFLLVGDFNLPEIRWTGAADEAVLLRRTTRAVKFLDSVTESEAIQSVASPTRGENVLDLAVSRGGPAESEVCDGVFDSDHSAVVTRFAVTCVATPRATRSRAYDYKRADWSGLRAALRLIPWCVLSDVHVDDAVSLFYDFVFSAIADFIPMCEIRKQFPPWFDRSVRELLRSKEAAFRCKKSSPTDDNIARHRTARADFKRAASSKYREYLVGMVRSFRDNPKRYWSFVKSLKSFSHVSPVLEYDGRIYSSDEDRANCLNACFSRKFCDPVANSLPTPPCLDAPGLDTFTVSRERVAQLLSELCDNKACGPDGLSARILRECADELSFPLYIICQSSLRSGTFPAMWKQANVIPVYKKGPKKSPDNYRPVSLLSICSKVLEKVVCDSLLTACLPVLPASQHGFLPKRSCVTNLSCFLEHCWASIARGKQTDAVYTDFSSAFTSVNHTLLLHKLTHSFGISGRAIRWLESYLSSRTQRVVLNGKASDWVAVLSGVPEGSILGPLLFACYLADLPCSLSSECIMYADDVKLYRRIECDEDCVALQSDLDRLSEWSRRWRLSLNPGKCKSISFTLRTSPFVHSYQIDGHHLERCAEIRDLGVLLDSKLTFAPHVDLTIAKANRMLGLLMRSVQTPTCPRRVRFDHKALTCAFFAHVRSVIEYGSVVWSGAAVTHLARFERLQHRFLMWLAVNSRDPCPSLTYENLLSHFGIPSIKTRFIQSDILFLHNIFHHRLDCTHLTSMFGLAAPVRRSRHTGLLNVPFARVNTVKSSFLTRIPATWNRLLDEFPTADLFHQKSFRCIAQRFANTQGTFIRAFS